MGENESQSTDTAPDPESTTTEPQTAPIELDVHDESKK